LSVDRHTGCRDWQTCGKRAIARNVFALRALGHPATHKRVPDCVRIYTGSLHSMSDRMAAKTRRKGIVESAPDTLCQ
jgi:hypothetical protein